MAESSGTTAGVTIASTSFFWPGEVGDIYHWVWFLAFWTFVIAAIVGVRTWRMSTKMLTHTVDSKPVPEAYVNGTRFRVGFSLFMGTVTLIMALGNLHLTVEKMTFADDIGLMNEKYEVVQWITVFMVFNAQWAFGHFLYNLMETFKKPKTLLYVYIALVLVCTFISYGVLDGWGLHGRVSTIGEYMSCYMFVGLSQELPAWVYGLAIHHVIPKKQENDAVRRPLFRAIAISAVIRLAPFFLYLVGIGSRSLWLSMLSVFSFQFVSQLYYVFLLWWLGGCISPNLVAPVDRLKVKKTDVKPDVSCRDDDDDLKEVPVDLA